MIKNKSSGFTLIELLIVIAIIGVLSSIVLSSLNSARTKGNDSKIKSQLSHIRSTAEIYASSNNESYTASTMASAANPCTGAMFVDATSKMLDLTGTASAWPSGVLLSCQATAGAYAVSANLLTSGLAANADHWCVDSTGVSKAIAAQLGSGVTACP